MCQYLCNLKYPKDFDRTTYVVKKYQKYFDAPDIS